MIVLPSLSVVVTAVWDVGVLEGGSDVPVSSSDVVSASSLVDGPAVVVSSGWSDVGEDVGAVVVVSSSVLAEVVGSASVEVGSVVGAVVVSGSSVVSGVVVGAVVSGVVESSDVVSSVVVGGADVVLEVTPVPTTCRLLGMTP